MRCTYRTVLWRTIGVTLALLVVLALPATSFASGAPKIASSSAGTSNDEPTVAELHASIVPDGLETTYEFWIKNGINAAVKLAEVRSKQASQKKE